MLAGGVLQYITTSDGCRRASLTDCLKLVFRMQNTGSQFTARVLGQGSRVVVGRGDLRVEQGKSLGGGHVKGHDSIGGADIAHAGKTGGGAGEGGGGKNGF